jgi:hypothetical protein
MRRLLVVVLLAFTLAACESSKLDRAAAVVVSGRVLAADGAPAGGAPVALVREPSIGEIFTGLLVVPLTFGLACLGEAPAAGLCRGRTVERTVTGDDGTYRLNLTGGETQTAFGNTVDFTLSTAVSGATVTADFKIQTENLVLPDLQAWQPAVSVAAGRIGWDPPAPGSYQVVIEDGAGQLVWTFDSTRPTVTFDPRVLEDTAGKLAVSALTKAGAEGTSVSIRRQSARVDYRSTVGPPLSRGRPCTAGVPAGPVTPCPLTDGNFANELPRPAPATTTSTTAPTAPVPESTTIDLGRSAEVSFIVVRGCTCQVERSTDGQTWTAAGRATGYTVVVPARTGPARFIRLTGPLSDLHEVSIWEGPAPAATSPAPPATPGAPPAVAAPAPAPAAVSTEPSRTAPALIALVLLLLAAVGTAAGAFAVRRG